MINAKELRLGNKVGLITDNRIHEVTGIRKQRVKDGWYYSIIVDDEKDRHYGPENLLHITLTPEILERCGFEKEGKFYCKGNTCIFTNGVTLHGFSEAGYNHGIEIKSIHQLQNYCFANTGEYLEIKELV